MLLHGVFSGPFPLAWEFEPLITTLLILSAALYVAALRRITRLGVRRVPRSYPVCFFVGLAALALALIGPLDAYNENSFALHMAQHVTMMLVAAPLLVLGRPAHIALWALSPQWSGRIARPILRRGWLRAILTALTHPIVVLLLITVNLVLWHLPGFYVAALESDLIHEIEHVLFMGTSLLLWWVIVDPIPRHHKLRPDHAIAILFVTGTVGNLLSLYLLFAPSVLYSYYLTNETIWGMTQLADQRVGGLVMLVAGAVVFYGAMILVIVTSYSDTQSEFEESPRPLPTHD